MALKNYAFVLIAIALFCHLSYAQTAAPVSGPKKLEDSTVTLLPNYDYLQNINLMQLAPKLYASAKPSNYIVLGKYTREGWTLTYNDLPVKKLANNNFAIVIELTAKKTSLQLKASGPNGEVEKQVLDLILPDKKDGPEFNQEIKKVPPVVEVPKPEPKPEVKPEPEPAPKPVPKVVKEKKIPKVNREPSKSHIMFGMGYTTINYTQTLAPLIVGKVITAKAAYQTPLSSSTDVGVSGYFSALQLNYTPADVKIAFVGLNGRIGFLVTPEYSDWRVTISPGIYYATSFSKGLNIGYNNLAGFQLTPKVQYKNMGAYLKISPIASSIKFSLTDREIAFGFFYLITPHFSADIDISSLKATIETTVIDSKTTTLGVSYIW